MGTLLGAPLNKDYDVLGSILGSPLLGNYHIDYMYIYICYWFIHVFVCMYTGPHGTYFVTLGCIPLKLRKGSM